MAHSIPEARSLWLSREVLPHEDWLRRRLLRRFPKRQDLDDAIQETYLRLMKVEMVDTIVSPQYYLLRVALSVIYGRYRHEQCVDIEAIDDIGKCGIDLLGPEVQIAARAELSRVSKALRALPSQPREIFILRRIEGLSARNVACQLGISVSSIEKKLRKAQQDLRKCCEW